MGTLRVLSHSHMTGRYVTGRASLRPIGAAHIATCQQAGSQKAHLSLRLELSDQVGDSQGRCCGPHWEDSPSTPGGDSPFFHGQHEP